MTIHSVSILPYISGKGVIICEEMRKCFPDTSKRELKKHFIGGKVEPDESPLLAGCRETCEEVPLHHKPCDVESAIKESKHLFIDVTVSKAKNLENRFYVILVDSIKDEDIKKSFMNMVDDFDSKESSLVSLFYWDGIERLPDISSLIDLYLKQCDLDKIDIKKLEEHSTDDTSTDVIVDLLTKINI